MENPYYDPTHDKEDTPNGGDGSIQATVYGERLASGKIYFDDCPFCGGEHEYEASAGGRGYGHDCPYDQAYPRRLLEIIVKEPPPMPIIASGLVYFIRRGSSGPIKVGFTKDLEARLSSLQTASDLPLQVLAVFPATKQAESDIHQSLAESRIRGEWFAPTMELLLEIVRVRQQFRQPPLAVESFDESTLFCPVQ